MNMKENNGTIDKNLSQLLGIQNLSPCREGKSTIVSKM